MDDKDYFEYLKRRTTLGAAYRRFMLYPRIARRLKGRALDIGCGIGDMLRFARSMSGVDINSYNVDYCRGIGLDAHLMSPNCLPFGESTFDSALLDNVLEHIAEPTPLLDDIRRVLREHGRLIVGVPGRRGYAADSDHKVRYDEAGLSAVLGMRGFEIEEFFYTPLWKSSRLSEAMRQYCIYAVARKVAA
jgi:SAM-dependent methyltransferase